MASPAKENTPSNKRTRQTTKQSAKTDKKKRLNSTSIASITPIDLDSKSDSEEGMATKEDNAMNKEDDNKFKVKKPPATIAVSDLERLLDKRFSVLATAD